MQGSRGWGRFTTSTWGMWVGEGLLYSANSLKHLITALMSSGPSSVVLPRGSGAPILQYPRWLSGKETAANAGDADSTPGSGRFPWRRPWQPTRSRILAWRIPMDREEPDRLLSAELQKSWTRLKKLNHHCQGRLAEKALSRG